MLKKFFGSSAIVEVDIERTRHKVFKSVGPFVGFFEGGRSFGSDEEESSKRGKGQERRFAFGHFDGEDAQGPDINGAIVVHSADELGGHPIRSSDNGIAFVLLFSKLSSISKVCKLYSACQRKKNV